MNPDDCKSTNTITPRGICGLVNHAIGGELQGTEAIEAIILNMPEQGLDSIMQGMPEQGISSKSFTTMKNKDLSHHSYRFDICLPGTEIPEWFSHCNNIGSSIGIGLRDNWLNDDFMGFAVCILFDHDWDYERIECSIWSQASSTDFHFRIPIFKTAKSDHLWVVYLSQEILKELRSINVFMVTSETALAFLC
ncbi:hypothetical protein LWI29_010030 [Acer saccharum]|uniref:C-JID domain-containing protein n=1 Tax=Acer saccharum TaxID=4024 RepID=A0AA39V079_ACESA|nr:hypothetical protein LWI29_010030 [Acer saccharum]